MAAADLNTVRAREAETLWRGGEQHLQDGNADFAARAFEAGLSRVPDHVPMLLGLVEALRRQGHHRRPRELIVQAYALVPDSAPLLFAVAKGLFHFSEFARLHDLLNRPAFRAAAPPHVLAEAAVLLATIGAAESAMQLVERALDLDPACAPALYVRGNLHTFLGDSERAGRDYRAALESGPGMYQAAWMLGTLRDATPGENRLPELLRQAQQATPGGHGELFIRYAIYKEAHDLGEHALAWRNLERAGQIGKQGSRFDRDAFTRMVDRMVATLRPGLLPPAAAAVAGSTPIFIVGMFRSGTSLLERILAGHPQVADGGESYAFAEEVRTAIDCDFAGAFGEAVLDRIEAIDPDAVASGYRANSAWLARGLPMFTEKLPSNVLNVGLIAMILPEARIIHVRRDAADTCFANLATAFSPVVDHAHDQLDVAAYHNGCAKLMAHWEAWWPDRILTLDYHDLVQDPAGQAGRVARFCGIGFDPAMLDLSRTGGSVVTASAAQVRQGIRHGRTGAWRPYADQLAPMMQALGIKPPPSAG